MTPSMIKTYNPRTGLRAERVVRQRRPRPPKADPAEETGGLLHCVPSSAPSMQRERRRLLESLFSDDHEPLVTFAPRKKGKSREKFTTAKCRSAKTIIYRNRWMHNALVILETDPDVIALSPYPVKVRYLAANQEQKAVWKDHIPSLAVLRSDGTIGFLDFLHDEDADAVSHRTNEIALSLREDFDATYQVWTATEILAQPRFFNANLIWAHRYTKAHIVASGNLDREILRQEFPLSIREIAERLDDPVTVLRFEGDPPSAARPLHYGINLVFSTCLRLAADGKLQLDTSTQITASTIILRRL